MAKQTTSAVEVSYTAGQEDTRRAIRNARILEEQTGQPARAVIASNRNTREVQAVIDSGQVYWHSLPGQNVFSGDDGRL